MRQTAMSKLSQSHVLFLFPLVLLALLAVNLNVGAAPRLQATAALTINNVEPTELMTESGGTITIFGSGFTTAADVAGGAPVTNVRLIGYGLLGTNVIDNGSLTAQIPPGVPTGVYRVVVVRGDAEVRWEGVLRIEARPEPTNTPRPTNTPQPTSTPSPDPINIISIEPNVLKTTGGSLTVLGSGFTAGTVARLIGYGILSTQYINETSLLATVPPGISAGRYEVQVQRGDEADTSGVFLTIEEAQTATPPPAGLSITGLEPASIENTTGGQLTVRGTGFTQNSVVRLVGYGVLSTQYLNETTLVATIPPGVNAGWYEVEVVRDDQTASFNTFVQITDPTKSTDPLNIGGIEPTSMQKNLGGQLTVSGSGFTQASFVRLVGYGVLVTQFVSENTLLATVPPGLDIKGYPVEVVRDDETKRGAQLFIRDAATATPTPGPGKLSVSSVEPTQFESTDGGTITVRGNNFTQQAVVRLVGYGVLPTTYINESTLSAAVPIGAKGGAYGLQVVRDNDVAGWNVNIIIRDPGTDPLQVGSIEPTQFDEDGGTMTVQGKGFTQGTFVRMVGYGVLATTYLNETTLQVTVPPNVKGGSYTLEVVRENDVTAWTGKVNITDPNSVPMGLSSIEPGQFDETGGLLTVRGAGFTQGTFVRLAGYGVLATTYLNATTLQATVPPNIDGGSYGLDVVRDDRTVSWTGKVNITDPSKAAMSVKSVEPKQFDENGGLLTVQGAGFTQGSFVRLVGHGVLATTYLNATTLQATVPPGVKGGSYALEVVRDNKTVGWNGKVSVTDPNNAAMSVSSVEPAKIESETGGTITVLGSGFTAIAAVRLVNYGILPTTFVNETTLSAQVPAGVTGGNYNVEVVRGEMVRRWGNGSLLIDDPGQKPLWISSAEPVRFEDSSGGNLTIFGNGFTQGTVVRLVGYGILGTTYINETTLTAQVPAQMDEKAYAVQVVRENQTHEWSTGTISVYDDNAGTASVLTAPQLLISNTDTGTASIKPGDDINLSFDLDNVGGRSARSVQVTLNSPGVALPESGSNVRVVGRINANESGSVELPLVVNDDLDSGQKSLDFSIQFYDSDGALYQTQQSIGLTVGESSSNAQPQLLIRNTETSIPNVIPGDSVTLEFDLANLGDSAAQDVEITLNSPSVALPESDSNVRIIEQIGTSGRSRVELPLVISDELAKGQYTLNFDISYRDKDGEQFNSQQTVGLTIGSKTSTAQPRLILVGYEIADRIEPGGFFDMDVTVRNVGDAPAENLELTLGGPGGAQLSPFAIVNAGNRQFVPLLPEGETFKLSQRFIVEGGADARPYTLPLDLAYEDADETTYDEAFVLSLIVETQPKFQVSFFQPVEVPTIGQELKLPIEVVNIGQTLVNVNTISLRTFPDLDVQDGSLFIGPLDGGTSTTIQGIVFPDEPGTLDVIVEINYLDEFNREQVFTDELTIEVEDDESFVPGDGTEGGSGSTAGSSSGGRTGSSTAGDSGDGTADGDSSSLLEDGNIVRLVGGIIGVLFVGLVATRIVRRRNTA